MQTPLVLQHRVPDHVPVVFLFFLPCFLCLPPSVSCRPLFKFLFEKQLEDEY